MEITAARERVLEHERLSSDTILGNPHVITDDRFFRKDRALVGGASVKFHCDAIEVWSSTVVAEEPDDLTLTKGSPHE